MKEYRFLYLLVLFISEYSAQNPSIDWNGDSNICIVDPSNSSTDDTPIPPFPNQAEFVIETVRINRKSDVTSSTELTMNHYLYNYDNNSLVLIKNRNNTIDVEHYYYETLKKSIYHRRNVCTVSDINTEIERDGTSAVKLQNNTWHIRPLNELLLFSSNNSSETKTRSKFLDQTIIRGIPVDRWESCMINKTERRTYRIVWSLAQQGIIMPNGLVSGLAVPVHALINASIVNSDNIEVERYDATYNVYSYKSKVVETGDYFVPPRGVFCKNENLKTLEEFGIQWPDYFSVRVEASTSRSTQWQRFHLRYDHNRQFNVRRLRYDYTPPGVQDFLSVIHDYGDNLTYTIDRTIGTCHISRGVEYPDVDPIRDPIGFFLKHEDQFIFNSRDRIWNFNGNRLCRTGSIRCLSVISSLDNYPVIIEPDTGKPSNETWEKTDIEYGWSVRSPRMEGNFDYPVYLFLRLYQSNNENTYTEDIEYEFYEISHERNPTDFDISLCYRSLNFEYLHLAFVLKPSQANLIDGNNLNRRLLEETIHENLIHKMKIKYRRITDLEIFHLDVDSDVFIFFTVLGRTPRPEPPTNDTTDDEPTANQAYIDLKKSIDDGTFEFTIQLTNNSTSIQFRAVSGSLQSSKQFMSTHTIGKQVINKTYLIGVKIGAIIGGLLVGLILGILLVILIRIVRKKPIPYVPSSFSNPLPTITFSNKKPTTASSDA